MTEVGKIEINLTAPVLEIKKQLAEITNATLISTVDSDACILRELSGLKPSTIIKDTDELIKKEFVENKRLAIQIPVKSCITESPNINIYARFWDPEAFTISNICEVQMNSNKTIQELLDCIRECLGIEDTEYLEGFKIENGFNMYFNRISKLTVGL